MGIFKKLRGLWERSIPELIAPNPQSESGAIGDLGRWQFHSEKRPPFQFLTIEEMSLDPRVAFALRVNASPLSLAEVEITGPRGDVNEFIKLQWDRIWQTSAPRIADTARYGFQGFECMYLERFGKIEIKELLDRHPRETRAITQGGQLAGITVHQHSTYDPIYAHRATGGTGPSLMGMKALWLTHRSRYGRWYGYSSLEEAYAPYYEKRMTGGAIDLRNLRMVKDAWLGVMVNYPMYHTLKRPNGTTVSGRDIAREVQDMIASGGAVAIPSDTHAGTNAPLFTVTRATDVQGATPILEWKTDLDKEIWEGIVGPQEIIEAAASGSGFSGRSIPFLTWLLGIADIFNDYVRAIDRQILKPLAVINFGEDAAGYEIKPKSIVETIGKIMGGGEQGDGQQPGGGGGGGPPRPVMPNTPPVQVGQHGGPTVQMADGHSLACLMAEIPQPLATEIMAAAAEIAEEDLVPGEDIAEHGAEIAERHAAAIELLEKARFAEQSAEYSRNRAEAWRPDTASAREFKASAEKNAATDKAAADAARKAARSAMASVAKDGKHFKAKHGISHIDAWEAHTGRQWTQDEKRLAERDQEKLPNFAKESTIGSNQKPHDRGIGPDHPLAGLYMGEWHEADHPRDGGKFAEKEGAEKAKAKKPHEMTLEEFIQHTGEKGGNRYFTAGKKHQQAITDAMEQGKVIPLEAVEDYPDLKREVQLREDRHKTNDEVFRQHLKDNEVPDWREGRSGDPDRHQQKAHEELLKSGRYAALVKKDEAEMEAWYKANPDYDGDDGPPDTETSAAIEKMLIAKIIENGHGDSVPEELRTLHGFEKAKKPDAFTLSRAKAKGYKPAEFDNADKTKQRKLIDGLDALPGQQDLFNAAGEPTKPAAKPEAQKPKPKTAQSIIDESYDQMPQFFGTATSKPEAKERWITINGDSGDDGDGGVRIRIDGKGNITAGPAGLAKIGIRNISDFRKHRGKGARDPELVKEAAERINEGREYEPANADNWDESGNWKGEDFAFDFADAIAAASVRERLQALLDSAPALTLDLQAQIEALIHEVEPELSESLARAMVDAWTQGTLDIAAILPDAPASLPAAGPITAPPVAGSFSPAPPLPPAPPVSVVGGQPGDQLPFIDGAVRILETKNVLKRPQFDLLSRAQKSRAWTVAGDLTIESLDKMRATLEEVTRSGANLVEFRAKVMETFDGLPISDAHLENVFRTNVLSAYSEGKNDVLKRPTVEDAFPYRAFYATHDTRVRPDHLRIETAGIGGSNVFHKDDPSWEVYRPPVFYQCRCSFVPLSIEAAAEMGVQEAIEWLRTGVEPPHPPVKPIKDLEHF